MKGPAHETATTYPAVHVGQPEVALCWGMLGHGRNLPESSSVNPNPSPPEIGEAYMISERFDWLMLLGRRALATFLRSSPTASLPTRAS